MFAIRYRAFFRGVMLGLSAAGLAACMNHVPETSLPTASAAPPLAIAQAGSGESVVRISLLTYNIAGLPWPRRSGTRGAMDRIVQAWPGEFDGDAPDILVLQEAFVPSATRLPLQVGFAHVVRGPHRGERAEPLIEPADRAFRKARRLRKGEKLGKVVGSGLLLATDLPIVGNLTQPFGRHSCAGYDCLSNKGAQLVEIAIPGMPEPLFVLNTHLNSNGASGVPTEHALYAYLRQLREIEILLEREWQGRGPLIVAGDFNARGNLDRFTDADERIIGGLAHRYCLNHPDRCQSLMSWDNDAPWMDTQDLQGFRAGRRVTIEPVAIRARFDTPRDGRMLSDHDGLEVTWELRWRALP